VVGARPQNKAGENLPEQIDMQNFRCHHARCGK